MCTTKEALLASLAAVGDADAVTFSDQRYMDWSMRADDGARSFEAGDGDGFVQLTLTRAELLALHSALTRTLLSDQD